MPQRFGRFDPQRAPHRQAAGDQAHQHQDDRTRGEDGRWIAYGSGEAGRYEIWVQPFPPTGSKWQVSSEGATQVRLGSDGRELFYMLTGQPDARREGRADDRLVVLRWDRHGRFFRVDNAHPSAGSNVYEVTRDGRRFLFNVRPRATPDL